MTKKILAKIFQLIVASIALAINAGIANYALAQTSTPEVPRWQAWVHYYEGSHYQGPIATGPIPYNFSTTYDSPQAACDAAFVQSQADVSGTGAVLTQLPMGDFEKGVFPIFVYSSQSYHTSDFYGHKCGVASSQGGPLPAEYGWGTAAIPIMILPKCTGYGLYPVTVDGVVQCVTLTEASSPPNICEPGDSPVSGPPMPTVGNPIATDNGAKIQSENDYITADHMLKIDRQYSSQPRDIGRAGDALEIPGFGDHWHGLIPGRLIVDGYQMSVVKYLSPSGGVKRFGVVSPPSGSSDPSQWTFWTPDFTQVSLSMIVAPTQGWETFFKSDLPTGPISGGEVKLSFADGNYILFRRAGSYIGNTGNFAEGRRYLVPVEQGFANGYKIWFDYPDTGQYPNVARDSLGRQMALTWTDIGWASPELSGFYKSPDVTAQPQGMILQKAISAIALPDGTHLAYSYGVNHNSGYKGRLETVQHLNAADNVLWARTYLYEDSNLPNALTGMLDQNGNRLSTYAYDAEGRAVSTELAGGVNRYQVTYSGDEVRQVTGPLGLTIDYSFDTSEGGGSDSGLPSLVDVPHRLVSVARQSTGNFPSSVQSLDYSLEGLMAGVTDAKGHSSSQSNDVIAKRPTTVTDAKGVATTLEWHPEFDLVTREIRPNLTKDYAYDASGQLISSTETDTTTQTAPYSTNGQTRTTTYSWNSNGRLLSVNGPRSVNAQGQDDVTTFTYDGSGNRLTMTDPLGHVTSYANYDANGRPGEMTDPNGIKTVYAYDELGRVTSITLKDPADPAQDAVTTLDYDIEGRIVGMTLPETEKLMFEYDLAGRLLSVHAADGERMDYTYDAMGNVLSETALRSDGSQSRSVTRTFDEIGRLLTETLGPGRTTSWSYDKNDNPKRITSPRGNATDQAFDALDRLASVVAPDSGTSDLVYDEQDHVTRFTDADAVKTRFIRNGFGDVIREVSPDRGNTTYTYDEAGDLIRSVDGRGQRIDYTRDIMGRVLRKNPAGQPGTENVDYTWDAGGISGSYGIGRLAKIADSTGVTKWRYDHRGNMVIQRQQLYGTTGTVDVRYAYDLANRIVRITYPSGRQVKYVRDIKGRIVAVRTRVNSSEPNWTTVASGIKYEAFGSLRSEKLGNGLKTVNNWSDDGLLVARRLIRSDGTDISKLTYGYDADDNITRITDVVDPARTQKMRYDNVGRLKRMDSSSGAIQRVDYAYDVNGNRLQEERRALPTDNAPLETDVYTMVSGQNALASVVTPAGTRAISYDGRGNTIAETRPGGVDVSVSYDAYGRLTAYSRTGEANLSHVYNGLDDRIATSTGTGIRRFVYDPDGRVLGEYGNDASDVKAEFIWTMPDVANDNQPFGGDDGVAGYAPLAVAVSDGAGSTMLNWVHGNHLGVPLIFTDALGNSTPPSDYSLPGFPGQSRTLADLYYNRYRDFDPTLGRYIQADPIGLEGGVNPYLYARGNPLRYTDPQGKFVPLVLCGVGALAGGVATGVGEYLSEGSTSFSHLAIGAGVGCAAGALAPFAGAAELGAVANIAQYGLTQYFDGCDITVRGVIGNAALGALGGKLSGSYKNPQWVWDTSDTILNKAINNLNAINSNVTTPNFLRSLFSSTLTNYFGQ